MSPMFPRAIHRSRRCVRLLLAVLCLVTAPGALALAVGDRVDNFRLLDHRGESHELYRLADRKAVAVLVQGNGCPIVRNAMPRFRELAKTFSEQGVEFLLLNTNLQDSRDSISREVEEYGFEQPVLIDDTQLVGEALGLVRTGEVFVIDPATWTVAYQGLLDDRLTYENQKAAAKAHYLRDALNDMLAGEAVQVASTRPVGCLINFPERGERAEARHASISYSDDIAPLLIEKCVSCHRPGGIGSWEMANHTMIRGFGPMIREVVRTQRMPPWHADPHHGEFSNDRSLTVAEKQMLVHWIEAGAPRGKGADPLATYQHDWPEWALGEPDLIIDIPEHAVPATGTVPYQYQSVDNPLNEDRWVRAVEILPGDRKALHHVITTFGVPDENGRVSRRTRGSLGGYVPGAVVDEFPDGTGTLLPADAKLLFQMHYTSYGKPAVDRSRLGIYFHDKAPKHQLASMILMNSDILIPPHSNDHWESASRKLDRDVLVYSLLPHAHFRGRAMEFRAQFADGSEELLLSVPHYDFNWQTDYALAEPRFLPAGTTIVHRTSWDNTATNPANPDPSREVPWGEQSWDEMLFGAINLRLVGPEERAAFVAPEEPASGAVAALGGQ